MGVAAYDLNVAGYVITVFFLILFETTDFCFSLFNNTEIEALSPETRGQNPDTPGQTRRVGNPIDTYKYILLSTFTTLTNLLLHVRVVLKTKL